VLFYDAKEPACGQKGLHKKEKDLCKPEKFTAAFIAYVRFVKNNIKLKKKEIPI
jgi:hypothetical protein